MRSCQDGFAATGAIHAAALVRADGRVSLAAEDVGRHNAVDKVLGQAWQRGDLALSEHMMVVSEHVVPFSCKKQGFCPFCCAKRMAETRAHLLDNVLPLVPYRQFVISFPMAMRYRLHLNKKFLARVHRIIIDLIHGYSTSKALP